MEEKRKRMGRPPKDEPSSDTARVDIRMTPELRRRIRIAAAKHDIGMGAWLLEAALEKLAREEA